MAKSAGKLDEWNAEQNRRREERIQALRAEYNRQAIEFNAAHQRYTEAQQALERASQNFTFGAPPMQANYAGYATGDPCPSPVPKSTPDPKPEKPLQWQKFKAYCEKFVAGHTDTDK